MADSFSTLGPMLSNSLGNLVKSVAKNGAIPIQANRQRKEAKNPPKEIDDNDEIENLEDYEDNEEIEEVGDLVKAEPKGKEAVEVEEEDDDEEEEDVSKRYRMNHGEQSEKPAAAAAAAPLPTPPTSITTPPTSAATSAATTVPPAQTPVPASSVASVSSATSVNKPTTSPLSSSPPQPAPISTAAAAVTANAASLAASAIVTAATSAAAAAGSLLPEKQDPVIVIEGLTPQEVREVLAVLRSKSNEVEALFSTGTCTLPPKQLEILQKFLNFEESVSRGIFETGNRIVKALIKSSTNNGVPMPVTNESDNLKNLCILLQHVLLHGLKDKRTLFGVRKTTWDLVSETLEKKKPSALANAKNMTLSHQSKMTTWIKQSLMEKELAYYLQTIRSDKEILKQWYEPFAFMRDERSSIMFGMITALNSIEFNLFMKADDKDNPPVPTDLTPYIRGEMPGEIKITEPKSPVERSPNSEQSAEPLSEAEVALKKAYGTMSQQNAYLDEMNKSLQQKYESEKKTAIFLKASEQKLRKELEQSLEKVKMLEDKLAALEAEMKKFKEIFQQQIQEARDDAVQERKSFQNTKNELNNLYQREKKLREQAEEAFDKAMMKHAEAESRVSLLEREFEDAKLTFDHERCASNKEKVAVEKRLMEKEEELEAIKSTNLRLVLEHSQLKDRLASFEEEKRNMRESLKEMKNGLTVAKQSESNLEAELEKFKEVNKKLQAELQKEKQAKATAEEELAKETKKAATLDQKLNQAWENQKSLTEELEKSKAVERENGQLKKEIEDLVHQLSEKESTVFDLATELGRSKVKVDALTKYKNMMKKETWVDDHESPNCQKCKSAFTMYLRRHHCRNCGGIFCYYCSNNRMLLPVSANPVRVCDSCYTFLLTRYNAD